MVRASGYKSRGPWFDSRLYHGDFPWGGRIPVVTMVWVVSRIRFKVETSLTRSHTSINSWLNPRQRSPRWRGAHHERQPAHQLIEYPSTLIADYGRKKNVCFYVRTEQLGSYWTGFSEIWYLSVFRKSVEKIQVSLKSHKNSGYFILRPIYTFDRIALTSS